MRIELASLPLLDGAEALASPDNASRANRTNREAIEGMVRLESGEGSAREAFLFDPQTSGGLLIAIDASRAEELIARCREGGSPTTARVGEVLDAGEPHLVVTA